MKIAVCDDSEYDKYCLFNCLNGYCKDSFINAVITAYGSGESLLEDFKENMFDMIFLDIYMSGIDGIETAKKIRAIDAQCLLIFVTTSRDHALDGFAVKALHYLLKPVSSENLAEVFHRCKNLLAGNEKCIEVISERLPVKIQMKSIDFIEVYDKACFIHVGLNIIKTYLSLEEIYSQLDQKFFLRCHRSYVVNMCSIVNVGDRDFILKSGNLIPIRQSEKGVIKKTYMNFVCSLARDDHHAV